VDEAGDGIRWAFFGGGEAGGGVGSPSAEGTAERGLVEAGGGVGSPCAEGTAERGRVEARVGLLVLEAPFALEAEDLEAEGLVTEDREEFSVVIFQCY
jgi:hypothetical protein